MYKALRTSVTLDFLFAAPTTSLAGVAEDCVSIEIEEKLEHTCKHPNPFLRLFMKAPVYFTVVDNQCDQSIEIAGEDDPQGRWISGTVRAKAKSNAEVVGCGEPAKVPG